MAECECCGQPVADPGETPEERPLRPAPSYLDRAREEFLRLAEHRGIPRPFAQAMMRIAEIESGPWDEDEVDT